MGSTRRRFEDMGTRVHLARRRGASLWDQLRRLGPGMVAGASDNDPTTVGTLVVAGATTGYALSWLVILVWPMLATVQVIASQVGLAARSGLQDLVRATYGRGWGLVMLMAVLSVNAITIGADLKAGAAALGLLFHLPLEWFVVPYAAALALVLLLGSYGGTVRILKYVMLLFLAYVITAIFAHPDWTAVLHATLRPHLSDGPDYVQAVLAIVGTTLTSYAYVWEMQEEAENRRPGGELRLASLDAALGMAAAVAIFWFILIITGATLGANHRHVDTAEQAAAALRPLAGPLASVVFGVGLLASSAIAVPVLAATSAYLLCQQFGWPGSLSLRLSEGRKFYGVAFAAIVLAAAVSFSRVSPIVLLFWASLAGGLATPVSLVFLMLMARHQRVMRGLHIGRPLEAAGWLTTALITAVATLFIWQQIHR
jgi:Mn2+/Fe2+ NRAMP family transporter